MRPVVIRNRNGALISWPPNNGKVSPNNTVAGSEIEGKAMKFMKLECKEERKLSHEVIGK